MIRLPLKLMIRVFTLMIISNSPICSQGLTSRQIDSLVARTMKMMPLAGLAVAVVKDGKVVHAKGYGITAVSSKQNVDENTLFAIASNSKAFTTAALAILVDEGKLRWHDKVVDYIPEFRMYNPYVTDNFNIQDLLTHRSGLGLGAGDLMFFPDGSNFTVNDVIRSFQYQVPVSAFRTKYDYDNLLYVVAGEVVSRVSGMSWSEFVQKRIMNPLGMTRSAGVFQNIKDRSNIASPHSVVDASLKELKPYTKSDESLGAAGGIYASVNDLSKWMLMHLNNGRYGEGLSHELISEASRKELWRPHTFINFTMTPDARNNTHFTAYGLGWRLHDQAGHIVVSHTGGLPGMLSKTTLIPDLKLGVVVLTNTDPGGRSFQTISMSIVDSYLGLDPFDYISDARQTLHVRENAAGAVVRAVWRVIQQNKPPTIPLANLVGTYRDKWFGDVTIAMRDGALWFTSLRSPKLTGRMYYYQANTFAVKWEYQDMDCDAFATFTLDENGYGTAIGMKGISPNIDFSFDFHDLKLQKVKPEN